MQNISMTASTDTSRLQFVNGQTIHHWSGYGDGHTDVNTLIERIRNHGAYKNVKMNILLCDCLVIDEIGLISQKLFEIIELICRSIRNNNMFFGGIQIITAGSFKQLPLVPNFTDPGRFCSRVQFLSRCFHIICY